MTFTALGYEEEYIGKTYKKFFSNNDFNHMWKFQGVKFHIIQLQKQYFLIVNNIGFAQILQDQDQIENEKIKQYGINGNTDRIQELEKAENEDDYQFALRLQQAFDMETTQQIPEINQLDEFTESVIKANKKSSSTVQAQNNDYKKKNQHKSEIAQKRNKQKKFSGDEDEINFDFDNIDPEQLEIQFKIQQQIQNQMNQNNKNNQYQNQNYYKQQQYQQKNNIQQQYNAKSIFDDFDGLSFSQRKGLKDENNPFYKYEQKRIKLMQEQQLIEKQIQEQKNKDIQNFCNEIDRQLTPSQIQNKQYKENKESQVQNFSDNGQDDDGQKISFFAGSSAKKNLANQFNSNKKVSQQTEKKNSNQKDENEEQTQMPSNNWFLQSQAATHFILKSQQKFDQKITNDNKQIEEQKIQDIYDSQNYEDQNQYDIFVSQQSQQMFSKSQNNGQDQKNIKQNREKDFQQQKFSQFSGIDDSIVTTQQNEQKFEGFENEIQFNFTGQKQDDQQILGILSPDDKQQLFLMQTPDETGNKSQYNTQQNKKDQSQIINQFDEINWDNSQNQQNDNLVINKNGQNEAQNQQQVNKNEEFIAELSELFSSAIPSNNQEQKNQIEEKNKNIEQYDDKQKQIQKQQQNSISNSSLYNNIVNDKFNKLYQQQKQEEQQNQQNFDDEDLLSLFGNKLNEQAGKNIQKKNYKQNNQMQFEGESSIFDPNINGEKGEWDIENKEIVTKIRLKQNQESGFNTCLQVENNEGINLFENNQNDDKAIVKENGASQFFRVESKKVFTQQQGPALIENKLEKGYKLSGPVQKVQIDDSNKTLYGLSNDYDIFIINLKKDQVINKINFEGVVNNFFVTDYYFVVNQFGDNLCDSELQFYKKDELPEQLPQEQLENEQELEIQIFQAQFKFKIGKANAIQVIDQYLLVGLEDGSIRFYEILIDEKQQQRGEDHDILITDFEKTLKVFKERKQMQAEQLWSQKYQAYHEVLYKKKKGKGKKKK
ncbi:WD40-repeat-containing domain [Pseudocohnilembus persalinus]|uniref:WD40-repeat-containing domain n=1 Tax=Pseudocohnilembus persalinus TaxID=266149 RepID=A0A0V0QXN7_PSEPJ|nr:WD40-repeat-containing domain [Pseudocohnilembus persalinus]|eukprot:KRX06826.1 WD40-repeat-containing domain [Pseudocohnilembus persalinus]